MMRLFKGVDISETSLKNNKEFFQLHLKNLKQIIKKANGHSAMKRKRSELFESFDDIKRELENIQKLFNEMPKFFNPENHVELAHAEPIQTKPKVKETEEGPRAKKWHTRQNKP